MPVSSWSSTPGSNTGILTGITLDGANMNVPLVDDAFRDMAAQVAAQLGKMNFAGADMASAATLNLANATGWYIAVTGTTTITAMGTVAAGQMYILKFSAALTLTHNATTLILPGGVNIVTAANDVAIVVSLGGGAWRCISYQPASADLVVPGLTLTGGTSVAGSAFEIDRPITTGATHVVGGTSVATGGYLQVFGSTHSANAGDFILGTNGSARFNYGHASQTYVWRNTTTTLMSLSATTLAVATNVTVTGAEPESTLICTAPSNASYTIRSYGSSGGAGAIGYCYNTAYYGFIGYQTVGGIAYSFYGNGSALNSSAWTISDAKAKHDIADCDCHDAYGKVRAIGVKSYRKAGMPERRELASDEIGWLAQDIEKVIPEAVMDVEIPHHDEATRKTVGGDTVKATNDRTMLATLWAAVQHQAEIIEGLEARIGKLADA